MLVLAIDTATPQVSVALGGPDGIRGSFSAAAGRRHVETLAPAIALVRDATGVDLGSIDRVAVDVGPGLFTGLRVGLATAAGLGSALECPMVPVSSLDLLAHPWSGEERPVAAVVDARRAEVFWALYRPGQGRVTEPAVATPEDLAVLLAGLGQDVLVVGDGAERYRQRLSAPRLEVRQGFPSAIDLVAVAAQHPTVSPGALRPLYLRQADVRIGWSQRAPQTPAGAR